MVATTTVCVPVDKPRKFIAAIRAFLGVTV
jgi:hypothetical protein